jgi:hypothetical protein
MLPFALTQLPRLVTAHLSVHETKSALQLDPKEVKMESAPVRHTSLQDLSIVMSTAVALDGSTAFKNVVFEQLRRLVLQARVGVRAQEGGQDATPIDALQTTGLADLIRASPKLKSIEILASGLHLFSSLPARTS